MTTNDAAMKLHSAWRDRGGVELYIYTHEDRRRIELALVDPRLGQRVQMELAVPTARSLSEWLSDAIDQLNKAADDRINKGEP